MSPTWGVDTPPPPAPPTGPFGWARVLLRGLAVGGVTFGGLGLLLLLRLVERPLFGLDRPLTPWITVGVCRAALRLMGLRMTVTGRPLAARGAMVANHASWLDIYVLNAPAPLYFVSKAEVARWPAIGWLARATGTVFISRDSRDATRQKLMLEARLRAGHRLMVFPEGTSTDGRRVLAFKPTLLAAFFEHGLAQVLSVQPVSVTYHAPEGADPRFYGWWGAMPFAPHLLKVLAAPRQGRVDVVYHAPLKVSDYSGRKPLAAACEHAVRAGMRLPADAGG